MKCNSSTIITSSRPSMKERAIISGVMVRAKVLPSAPKRMRDGLSLVPRPGIKANTTSQFFDVPLTGTVQLPYQAAIRAVIGRLWYPGWRRQGGAKRGCRVRRNRRESGDSAPISSPRDPLVFSFCPSILITLFKLYSLLRVIKIVCRSKHRGKCMINSCFSFLDNKISSEMILDASFVHATVCNPA